MCRLIQQVRGFRFRELKTPAGPMNLEFPPSAHARCLFPRILIISHIAEIQGGFANTLMVEMGPDNASRIREVA
jgi:hypothetical protein